MSHPFAYAELHSTAPAATVDFYRRLFDWKTTASETPMGTYHELHPGEGLEGGAMQAMGPTSAWVVYLEVADVRAHIAKATALGARLLVDVTEVPGVGWFGLLADPSGATFGVVQHQRAASA